MAQGGRRGGKPAPRRATGKTSRPTKSTAKPQAAPGAGPPPRHSRPCHLPPGPFRLGAVPGATPGRWIDTWQQRMPRHPLELVPLEVAEQRDALRARAVDAALVRLPIDPDGVHTIALYDELPVVVCAADSHLTAADELAVDDLSGEVLITPRDDVLHLALPGTDRPAFAAPESTGEAIEIVATGVGIVVVPMSLARLHHRKDVTFRPLANGPVSTIALAWPRDEPSDEPRDLPGDEHTNTHADRQDLVEVFVGIVRGRTANSSR